ncbi:hypothetical protein A0J61_05098 [Choanephora cucurbitarum]|uniref:Uncharacterized protein n=1 Tax=Choanephora cucurbitarum TaxID=101091 RepID=A0A1C7NCL7_9FUNG|nr:hypothetical protein A0J61_05098 [Choanephora cucurbitarum]
MAHLPVKRDRSIWQEHLRNMVVEKALSFVEKDDLPAINSHRPKRLSQLKGQRQLADEKGAAGEVIGPAEELLRLGLRYLGVIRSHMAHLPVKRDRSIWQEHLRNMVVEKALSFVEKDDLQAIKSAYEEIVRDSLPMRKVLLEKSLGQLKNYYDWLLSEFDVHLVYVYAIDSIRANVSAQFGCNSEIGQQYKEFFKGNAGFTPERYMRYLVSSSGPNIRAQLQGLPSALLFLFFLPKQNILTSKRGRFL